MSIEKPPQQEQFSPNAIHLVRTAQQIHVQLSAMADQKASILMGASFVIFTIAIGQAGRSAAALPLLVLGATSFFSAILAVLSILPTTRQRNPGSTNLLFFGCFTQLPEEEHARLVLDRLRSDDLIYRMMLHDLYQNGLVMERKKYKLLGYAYRLFLVGLSLSFLSFVAQHVLGYRG